MATSQKERRDLEIKLSELDRMVIKAPRDGTIFRMPVFERGQTIKEGDSLFTLVPDTTDRVVEMWISGNDIPLVKQGDHVRLQFEGWPAVQLAGWPSVAVGTFGGQVAAIDASDDGKGHFRIQVRPDDPAKWPDVRYLRQGVRANGWVMLSQVRLGYEIWRQLNGFPPLAFGRSDEVGGQGRQDQSTVAKMILRMWIRVVLSCAVILHAGCQQTPRLREGVRRAAGHHHPPQSHRRYSKYKNAKQLARFPTRKSPLSRLTPNTVRNASIRGGLHPRRRTSWLRPPRVATTPSRTAMHSAIGTAMQTPG